MGFRHSLAEDFPDLKIVQEIEIRDDIERAYQETRKLLENVSDLRGIYDIGAVNRGIARAIEDAGRNRNMVFIGHELTEHTRRFLLSGTMDAALDQNPRAEAREAIDQLIRAIRGETRSNGSPIRIEALFRENIPDD
jgi:LacI family transcriptional regulator